MRIPFLSFCLLQLSLPALITHHPFEAGLREESQAPGLKIARFKEEFSVAVDKRDALLAMQTPTPEHQAADSNLQPVDDSMDLSRLPGVHFLTHWRDWLDEEDAEVEEANKHAAEGGEGEATREGSCCSRVVGTPKPWGRRTPRSGRPAGADETAAPKPRRASLWRPAATPVNTIASSRATSSSSSSSVIVAACTSLGRIPCPFVSPRYRTLSEGLFHSMVQKELPS